VEVWRWHAVERPHLPVTFLSTVASDSHNRVCHQQYWASVSSKKKVAAKETRRRFSLESSHQSLTQFVDGVKTRENIVSYNQY
jgi:hypothetical protein